jgi:hypothetical protein
MADAASDTVKDAYRALTAAVRKRFASHPRAETALDGYLEDPDTWRAPLEKALADTGADGDTEFLEAARQLILVVPPADARTYSVDVRDSQGVQIGDHGRQTNVFGASSPPQARSRTDVPVRGLTTDGTPCQYDYEVSLAYW